MKPSDFKNLENESRKEREARTHPANKIANARRRANRAMNSGDELVTCPASRHVMIMADALSSGDKVYPMLIEEPEHCAGAFYSVCERLWKARAEIQKLKKKSE